MGYLVLGLAIMPMLAQNRRGPGSICRKESLKKDKKRGDWFRQKKAIDQRRQPLKSRL